MWYRLVPARVVNLRDGRPMAERAATGRGQLARVVRRDAGRPQLVGGLVLSPPIPGIDTYFGAGALATRCSFSARVAEVRSIPRDEDRCEAEMLAAADQAASSIELVRQQVGRLVSKEAVFAPPATSSRRPPLSRLYVGPRVCPGIKGS